MKNMKNMFEDVSNSIQRIAIFLSNSILDPE